MPIFYGLLLMAAIHHREDGYIVVRYNAVQDSWEEVERLDSDVTEYIDNTLSCEEQKHFYQVVAFRGDTWSPFSNQASERPCADAEITAVVTTVSTNTPTSTSTPTAMMTAMPTATPTGRLTSTPTSRPTSTPTSMATAIRTVIPTAQPSATAIALSHPHQPPLLIER